MDRPGANNLLMSLWITIANMNMLTFALQPAFKRKIKSFKQMRCSI